MSMIEAPTLCTLVPSVTTTMVTLVRVDIASSQLEQAMLTMMYQDSIFLTSTINPKLKNSDFQISLMI